MADTKDQEYTGSNGNQYFGYPDRNYCYQSFTTAVGKAGYCTKLTADLKIGAGTPTGTVTGYLYSDNGGVPGTLLSTLSAINCNLLTGAYQTFSFTKAKESAYWMGASTKYHLVLLASAVDASNYIHIYSNVAGAYTGGDFGVADATPTWAPQAGYDVNFSEYYDPIQNGAFFQFI